MLNFSVGIVTFDISFSFNDIKNVLRHDSPTKLQFLCVIVLFIIFIPVQCAVQVCK